VVRGKINTDNGAELQACRLRQAELPGTQPQGLGLISNHSCQIAVAVSKPPWYIQLACGPPSNLDAAPGSYNGSFEDRESPNVCAGAVHDNTLGPSLQSSIPRKDRFNMIFDFVTKVLRENTSLSLILVFCSFVVVWRAWRFTMRPLIYSDDPNELPYWFPCKRAASHIHIFILC
jgi:hypothetical protein